MLHVLIGILITLHGLVHIWYIVLARQIVPFKPELGWTGRSWLFTDRIGDARTRGLASILLLLPTLGFAAGGIGYIFDQPWSPLLLAVTAGLSTLVFLLLWDGDPKLPAEKGLVGVLINAALTAGVLLLP
jgi:hypothetical protein